jgi:phenylacetate-CoA ligase
LEQTQWLSQAALEDMQRTRLRALVAHAYDHSAFYRAAFVKAGIVPGAIQTLDDLRRLPVLEKADLRDRVADIMTGPRVPGLVRRKTSGSTGVPIELWASAQARDLWVATSARFMRWWQVGIGDRRLTLISRHGIDRLGWLKQFLFANVLEYSAMDLSDAALARVCARLTGGGVRLVLGYPSSLVYLAGRILDSGRLPTGLRAVVTTGEMLHPDQRALLDRVFQCPVANEYGTSEVGHIAGECPHGRMHVAAESVLVECPPDGEAAAPGGRDLLITDLTNLTTPLIRYRIGDLGWPGDACPCGRGLPVLRLGAGRPSELVLLSGGRRVDFSIFDVIPDELAQRGVRVEQWRVLQHAVDHFEVLLASRDPMGDDTAERVTERIVAALRSRVRVDVRHVAQIPPDATGKRRRFISDLDPAERGDR